MTKDQAIEVLIAHAKRCPEPEPSAHGHPEDFRDDYREWLERRAKVNEAVSVLTVPAVAGPLVSFLNSMAAVTEAVVERKVLARYCPNLGGNCAMLDICTRSDRCELIKRS